MKKNLIRKVICILFAGIALVVLVFVIRIATQQSLSNLGDWFIVLLPVLTPLLSAFINLKLYPNFKRKHLIRRVVLWGGFVGINGILIIMVLYLFSQYQDIKSDGTAFWAYLFIPCFYIGLPSVIVGVLIGLIVGLIVNEKNKDK